MVNVAQQKVLQMFFDLVLYEISHSGDGMLISQEADRLVAKYPIGGRVFILAVGAVVTLHLANVVSDRYDLMAKHFWRRLREQALAA